ncbi:hypothetical protein TNCV_1444141 [Trichonephila clavipes]|nr:hypothetical protein TNCV_1444141 [Trichonephila clavipes]
MQAIVDPWRSIQTTLGSTAFEHVGSRGHEMVSTNREQGLELPERQRGERIVGSLKCRVCLLFHKLFPVVHLGTRRSLLISSPNTNMGNRSFKTNHISIFQRGVCYPREP